MSNMLVTAAWEVRGLPRGEKMVLCALADQANDSGYCWPSVLTIAQRAGYAAAKDTDNIRACQRALAKLEDKGWIKTEERWRKNGSQTSNGYQLNSHRLLKIYAAKLGRDMQGGSDPQPQPKPKPELADADKFQEDYIRLALKHRRRKSGNDDPKGYEATIRRRIDKQGGLSSIDMEQLKKWRKGEARAAEIKDKPKDKPQEQDGERTADEIATAKSHLAAIQQGFRSINV
ncbi:helix-turn-helix domain-containing protein [uncultured Desulfuromusa sp.]|uniref:helix-turn-helix domain-containing protein n=1 Tax=uncultured Desulfuromusa sp. TaxID=219183 RepID=UPI002AA65794|nr:helix-turn-helix domain-containing protein [uncultured Desulfuromusa sp.]